MRNWHFIVAVSTLLGVVACGGSGQNMTQTSNNAPPEQLDKPTSPNKPEQPTPPNKREQPTPPSEPEQPVLPNKPEQPAQPNAAKQPDTFTNSYTTVSLVPGLDKKFMIKTQQYPRTQDDIWPKNDIGTLFPENGNTIQRRLAQKNPYDQVFVGPTDEDGQVAIIINYDHDGNYLTSYKQFYRQVLDDSHYGLALAQNPFDSGLFDYEHITLYSKGNISSTEQMAELAKEEQGDLYYQGKAFLLYLDTVHDMFLINGGGEVQGGHTLAGTFSARVNLGSHRVSGRIGDLTQVEAIQNSNGELIMGHFDANSATSHFNKTIRFNAKIEDNRFTTAQDADTEVNGHFYGDKGQEIGGTIKGENDGKEYIGAFGGSRH